MGSAHPVNRRDGARCKVSVVLVITVSDDSLMMVPEAVHSLTISTAVKTEVERPLH